MLFCFVIYMGWPALYYYMVPITYIYIRYNIYIVSIQFKQKTYPKLLSIYADGGYIYEFICMAPFIVGYIC